jgi:hypothetical protein
MNRSPRMLFYILIAATSSIWAGAPANHGQHSTDLAAQSIGVKAPIVHSAAESKPMTSNVALDKNNTKNNTTPSNQEPWLTVFVHGIKSVKPHISLDNFFRFMVDDIEDTIYAKTIELMRKDPFFFMNQPMREIGLHRADPNDIGRGKAANAIARLFDEINVMMGGQKNNYYYTYGWSGLLSPKMRYKDAEFFFIALEKELKKYHDQGIYPRVRVIGYSHGGNVCLNLERIRRDKYPDSTMSIDQLLLLGSPIQGETDFLVNGPLFKRVYNFFSHADRIQRLDFFSFDRFFSGRTFTNHKCVCLPKKLTQVQIKVTRNARSTNCCPRKQKLAENLNNCAIISGNSNLVRDISPGHSELWFFGWTPVHYRETYPLHPFPTVAFAPFIINELEKLDDVLPSPQPIVVDLRPDNKIMLVRPQQCATLYAAVPLLSQGEFEYLKKTIEPYAFDPSEYSAQEYNKHIQLAYEHARAYYAKLHEKGNPIAQKNQAKKICRDKRREARRQRAQQMRNRKITMNVAMHQELNCPFCFQTMQVLSLFYRSNIHNLMKSSIDSCCARELRRSCESLLMS